MMNDHPFPTDPALPTLPTALDPSVMKIILQSHLFVEEFRSQPLIIRCDIFHTRYKRGRSCMICYRLILQESQAAQTSEQILCARMFEEGGAVSRFQKAQTPYVVPSAFGKSLSLIPELNMVLWAFPNDRKLRGLPGLMNRNYLRNVVLPLIVRAHLGENWKIETFSTDLVHYVGEHTCTIRVCVSLEHTINGRTKTLNYFGKTYYNDEGALSYQAMQALWNSESRRNGRLLMAQPLWYDKDLLTLWQCGLEGTTLADHDLHRTKGLHLLQQAAAAVATLHHTPVPCSPIHTIEKQIRLLQDVQELLGEVMPPCRTLLAQFTDRLRRQVSLLEPGHIIMLHGDLHLKNFLATSDGIALIDFDNLLTGSPLYDIGSFLAGFYHQGLIEESDPGTTRTLADCFLKTYETHTPQPVSHETLAWFVAMALITERAYRCVTRLKAGRFDLIPKLLGLADAISRHRNPLACDLCEPTDHTIRRNP